MLSSRQQHPSLDLFCTISNPLIIFRVRNRNQMIRFLLNTKGVDVEGREVSGPIRSKNKQSVKKLKFAEGM